MNCVVENIWLRSGHLLLVRMLRKYFGPELRYSRTAAEITGNVQKRGGVLLLGNDSIGLFGLQSTNFRYLIQYRSFESWIVSTYDRILGRP
jgi:hypothetical protein